MQNFSSIAAMVSEIPWVGEFCMDPWCPQLQQSEIDHLGKLKGIKVRVVFGKNIEKKHFCLHDKNYYYFWKSNIYVINLIVDSRNIIKISKNMRL